MKSNEGLNKYKFVLPSGTIYEHEFKSITPLRSVKITLIQNRKIIGSLETIKFIANHQYASDSWKLEKIARFENKFIYVEHSQKSYTVLFRFLKDNNKSVSAFFAKNETVHDIKKYLANEHFALETNGDPSKIILLKGETMFNDNSIVEDLNIRKHDCLIVSIRDDNLLNNSRSLDNTVEFHLFENEPPPPPQKKEKRSPRHFNLKISGNSNSGENSLNPKNSGDSKMISNEFMHCQPIRASFPDHSGHISNDNETNNLQNSAGSNYNIIGNAQISKPKTKKTKETIPLRFSAYKSPEKSRIPAKRSSPYSSKKNGTNSSCSNSTNLSPASSPRQHQQIVVEKGKKVILPKPEGKNHSSPKSKTGSNYSNKLPEQSAPSEIIDDNDAENRNNEEEENRVQFQFEISGSEEEESDDENTFMFDEDNNDEPNEDNKTSGIKLPLPFQLPNGNVQSIMLTSNDTIGDVKHKFSELLNCPADTITLNLKGQELNDDSVQIMSISEYHGTTPIMIVVHVNETRPGEGKIQYFFRIDHEEEDGEDNDKLVAFYFDEAATVKEAREAVAGELNKEPKDITLIYNCKNLSDKILLRKLRIPVDGCIIVLVENSDEKIRLSTPLTVMKPRKPFKITFLTTDSSHQKFVLNVPPLSTVADIKEKVAEEMSNKTQHHTSKIESTKNSKSPSKTLSSQDSNSDLSPNPSLSYTTPVTKNNGSSQSDLSSSVDDFGNHSVVADQIDFFFGGKMLTDDLIFDGLGVHDGSKIVVNTIRPSTAKLSRSLRLSSTDSFKLHSTINNETSSFDDMTDEDEDIDKWEDELYQGISALELVRLQQLPPKGMPDAQKVIIYFRCNRDMKCTKRVLKSMM